MTPAGPHLPAPPAPTPGSQGSKWNSEHPWRQHDMVCWGKVTENKVLPRCYHICTPSIPATWAGHAPAPLTLTAQWLPPARRSPGPVCLLGFPSEWWCMDSSWGTRDGLCLLSSEIHVRVLSCFSGVPLCYTMDCSPPGFSVRGILQARILECTAMSSSRGPSPPKG